MDQSMERGAARVLVRGVIGFLAAIALVLGATACGDEAKSAAPSGTVTLPAAFPKADVPLVDGNLIAADERDQAGTTVFNVTVQAGDGGFDAAKRKLTDAGFVAVNSGAGTEGTTSAQFSGKGYVVTVSYAELGAVPHAVFYSVSKA